MIASRFGFSRAAFASLWLVSGILVCSGCGDSGAPPAIKKPTSVGKVHGKLTFKGEAVPAGSSIWFYASPESGFIPVSAMTQADGTYAAADVPAGQCKVRIGVPGPGPDTTPENMPADPGFPAKYLRETTSGETVDVKAGGDVEYNLDMKAE